MVFGRLVWSVGVLAVVVGMGGLWGPGRDCHEMNHVPERPLLAVFEVLNYMLNDLISFFCASALGANTSDIFNFFEN